MRPAKALLLAASSMAVFLRCVRPWYLRWGATDEEVARAMALDDRIAEPQVVSTRAVSVNAEPHQVWPWIPQMGESPRAGYYSYEWIERLQGMEVENSMRILPEFQDLAVGQSLDRAGNMTVLDIEPGRYLALGPPDRVDWLRSTWVIAVYPEAEGRTRLVTRVRAKLSPGKVLRNVPPFLWLFWLLMDPGVFVMERKMLLEIKKRAEALSRAAGGSARAAVAEGGVT